MAADAAMSPVGEQQSGMGCLGSCHPQVPVQCIAELTEATLNNCEHVLRNVSREQVFC